MTTLPEPPRTGLIDPASGMLSRPWVRFFDDLRRAIITGLDVTVSGRLDALEGDALFDSSGQTGGNSDYNDAAVRVRLDDLETELLFLNDHPPPSNDTPESSGTDDAGQEALISLWDGTAQLRKLSRRLDEANLTALTAPDATAALARLKRAVRDLEAAQAMATDAAGQIAALANRLQHLETEGSWS
jgi:hypothetical protein